MLFLGVIAFIAVPAKVFAEHVADPATRHIGAQYFTVGLAVVAACWLINWTVGRLTGHVDGRLEPAYVASLNRKYVTSTALLVAGGGLSFVRWEAGLVVAAATTLYYLRPPETPRYIETAPIIEGE